MPVRQPQSTYEPTLRQASAPRSTEQSASEPPREIPFRAFGAREIKVPVGPDSVGRMPLLRASKSVCRWTDWARAAAMKQPGAFAAFAAVLWTFVLSLKLMLMGRSPVLPLTALLKSGISDSAFREP